MKMIRIVSDITDFLSGDDEGDFSVVTVQCREHGTVTFEISEKAVAKAKSQGFDLKCPELHNS
jgi:hypothetical protein